MTPNATAPQPAALFQLPAWEGPPARLSLVRPGGGPVRIDGVWWPRSCDLMKELPPLLAVLDGRWSRISHITIDGANWNDGPSAMVLGGHTLRISRSSGTAHHNAVCLLCPGVSRCDLIVVPPETPQTQARRQLASVGVRAG